MAGNDHELLFRTPRDVSRYGDEDKVLLVESALADEVQTGIVVSEDDGKLVAEQTSKLSAEGEGKQLSGNA